MENPLLVGETSKVFKRRSDAITFGSSYQKAAALVDLAEDGVGLPEQILDLSSFHSAAKYYFFYMRFSFLWALVYFALLLLNFLEKPLWCANYSDYTCSDRDYYYLGQLPYLNPTLSFIYEGIAMIVLMVHTFFPISYVGFHLYWKSPLTRFKVICLLLLVADLLVYVLYLSPVAFDSLPFRVAPYIRVIFFILNFRELRSCMLILAGMFSTYLNVLGLGLLFLLFSSWLAYVIFEDTDQGTTIFTSYGTTFYQMFVLFTTSNNPDVWIPAYKASRWYCLFFVLYVLLGVYFVTNLILAVVYDSFKCQLVNQVSEMDKMRTTILKKAFHLIEKDNHINKDQCICLFEELSKYRTLPKMSREEFGLIFDELDDSGDIQVDRFSYSGDIQCEVKYWILILLCKWSMVSLYTGGVMFALGFLYYQCDQNVIGETITFAAPEGLTFLSNGEWIRYLLIARMLRLIRLLMHVKRCQAFIATFLALIPSLMPYLGTIFCVMCIYCTLGVQVFGGIVNAGNVNLEATDLYDNDYLLFNFNDYPNGMVTLFNLLVMGNWQVWMQSYKVLTGTSWSLLYFVSFYLITVLLLLNLVVAFVLEAFFAEMDLESAGISEGNQEAGRVKDRPRSVGSKSQSQRVDALLHHMLSAELNETQSSSA